MMQADHEDLMRTHVARFLNRDGTTRAEVYWAPEENALPLSRGLRVLAGERLRTHQDQVVQTSLVRNAGSAGREVAEVHYHTIPRRAVSSVEPLGVQTIVADSLKPGETFAVQWDQLLAAIGDDVVEVGPTARIAVLRTDRFELLRGDGRLEMSDIKPVVAATDEPYPFQTVEPTMPLALYFEVYGLTFGSEDQVDFRVDYEITLRREGGLLRRAPGGDDGGQSHQYDLRYPHGAVSDIEPQPVERRPRGRGLHQRQRPEHRR